MMAWGHIVLSRRARPTGRFFEHRRPHSRRKWEIPAQKGDPMETLLQDVRYAFRTIGRTPGFAVVAVLSLALGVGANTTIFTLLNAALLAPLPVERPSELVAVFTSEQGIFGGFGNNAPMSYLNLKDFRQRNEAMADMAGYSFP